METMVDPPPGPIRDRLVVQALTTVGAASLVALVVLCVQLSDAEPLLPAALATAFLAAGALGAHASPGHRGLWLLTSVGTLHLLGYALSGWAGAQATTAGWGPWLVALTGDGAYAAGFVTLAVLIASYPTGRLDTAGLHWFARAAALVALVAVMGEALFHPRLGLAMEAAASSLDAPDPLPMAEIGFTLLPLVPLLVVAATIILVMRARRAAAVEHPSLSWAMIAGLVLGLMLAASPAAYALLPARVWDITFVVAISMVPFALLGGLMRYRLLDVDLYIVRTLGRGTVVVLVLSAYATAAALLGRDATPAAAAGLGVLAALTGVPVMRRLESLTDKWLTGGRLGRRAVLDRLDDALTVTDPAVLGRRICQTVLDGLDVSWVGLKLAGIDTATAGIRPEQASAEVCTLLQAPGGAVGSLECGPRRGGWGRAEITLLTRLGNHAALALRDAELTRELARRVEELTASRVRLVRAEETVRRQVERDLHDGVQQQLVALLARLTVAQSLLEEGHPAGAAVDAAHGLAQQSLTDLRELVAGIHPALLGDRGLAAAVASRAGMLPIAVAVDTDPRILGERYPAEIEGAAFFVVSEALANVMKHSGSDHARVVLTPMDAGGLRVAITDEGRGTASYTGTGLAGLRDRVEAVGGRFVLSATPDVGTTVLAEFDTLPMMSNA